MRNKRSGSGEKVRQKVKSSQQVYGRSNITGEHVREKTMKGKNKKDTRRDGEWEKEWKVRKCIEMIRKGDNFLSREEEVKER